MSVRVSLDELFAALEWVSAGDAAAFDCSAYVSTLTGEVHWVGEGIDKEPPEDIEDGSIYVAVPHKHDLDLGRSLALRFIEEHLPGSLEVVNQYFRNRSAYSRFKALLDRTDQLEAWHRYEQHTVEEALRQWCAENGLTLAHEQGEVGG